MSRSLWGTTPRQSIEAACEQRGRDVVVEACLDLLAGREVDPALVQVLGGPRAARLLDEGSGQAYWLRVWAVRGLLWSWDDRAGGALDRALSDPAWRVREMAAKVVGRHLLAGSLDRVADLRGDPVARVRHAAARALARLTDAGA